MGEYLYLCRKTESGELQEAQPLDVVDALKKYAQECNLTPETIEIVFEEIQGRTHIAIQRKIS